MSQIWRDAVPAAALCLTSDCLGVSTNCSAKTRRIPAGQGWFQRMLRGAQSPERRGTALPTPGNLTLYRERTPATWQGNAART